MGPLNFFEILLFIFSFIHVLGTGDTIQNKIIMDPALRELIV